MAQHGLHGRARALGDLRHEPIFHVHGADSDSVVLGSRFGGVEVGTFQHDLGPKSAHALDLERVGRHSGKHSERAAVLSRRVCQPLAEVAR